MLVDPYALLAVTEVLKKKFNNLTTRESIELATLIFEAIKKTQDDIR